MKKENIIGNNNFVELVIPDLEDTKEEKKSKFFCIKKTNEAKGFESKKILQKIKEVLSPFNLYQNEMNVTTIFI